MSFILCFTLLPACGDSSPGSPDGPPAEPDGAAPADAASPDASSPDAVLPFTPGELPGLTLWFDGEHGITLVNGHVESWMDRAYFGALARSYDMEARPTMAPGAINGHPAVRFDGVNDYLAVPDVPNHHFGLDDFTVAMVIRYDALPTERLALFNKQATASPYPGIFIYLAADMNSIEAKVDATRIVPVNAPPSGVHLVVYSRSGSTQRLRVDDVQQENGDAAIDVSAPAVDISIGGRYQPAPMLPEPFAGDIAEIVVVHGPLEEALVTKLVEHLAEKYALDLGST
jgi:hypothetical protein